MHGDGAKSVHNSNVFDVHSFTGLDKISDWFKKPSQAETVVATTEANNETNAKNSEVIELQKQYKLLQVSVDVSLRVRFQYLKRLN